MTVAELMVKLQDFPPDMPVITHSCCGHCWDDEYATGVSEVTLRSYPNGKLDRYGTRYLGDTVTGVEIE